jgi:AraC family transcriptional activator of pobA
MKLISTPMPGTAQLPVLPIDISDSARTLDGSGGSFDQPDEDFIIEMIEEKTDYNPEDRNRYNLIICLSGSLHYSSGAGSFSLLAGGAYFSAPGRSILLLDHSADARIYKVSFKEGFISRTTLRESLLDKLLDSSAEFPAVCYSGEQKLEYITQLFAKLFQEVNNRQLLHKQMVKILFLEIMIELARGDERCAGQVHGHVLYHRAGQLHNQFLQLIEQHFIKLRLVKDYADLLFVSAKYLSEVIRKETGQTALGLIHSRLFSEAKFLLCRTELSVKEIADQLNFDTSSHFGRFIKQFSGYNPSDYRNIQCALI